MILKSTAVLAALILRVALGCRENLCNSCKCSGRKITCSDARFAQQAFHCDFTDYHVLSKTPVVIPWRSLSLEDVNTTSNITIDLRNAPLNCSSCENAWLMQWRTIETTTLRGLEDCAYCPQLSVFAWLNLPRIVFGYNNNMRCDGEKLMKKCAIPDVAEHKPLQFTELHEGESEAMWTCSSVYPKQNTSFAGCLSAIFRPIPLPGSATNSNDHKIVPTKFGDESGECVTEYELQRTPELNVTHSGFFGCSIRKGFIPAAEWRFVLFKAVVCLVLKKVMDKRTKQRAEQVSSSYHMDLLNPLLVQNPTYFDWMHSVQARTDILVITSDDLEIVREIGQGAFGQVHLVRRMQPSTMLSNENDHLLAMKQLKYVSPEKLVDLEHEASVLTKLSHPNIVKFYGITLIDGAFGLLFEYMSEGDLVTYLRNRSQDLQGTEPVPYSDMLRMSIQVASGLEYLHSHHMVHRDVAARNCLVATELIVKLSDFGMTRDVYVTDYYKMDSHTLVPLRWLPPESIVYRKFTVESDMWSFGVLLWEIFSGGQVPWYMYSNTEVLEIVKNGELLAKPDCCPETVYKTLMLRCWASKPSERISATNIKEKLTELLDSTSVYCSLTMDRSASLQQEYQNLTTLPTSNRHRSA
uniref:Protein kinase domain-containing protein n=1 Tax=Plectus sambesii TaxID=2011161 RepID=A0A914XF06_9BILA